MKKTIIVVLAIVIVASSFYYFRFYKSSEVISIIKLDNKTDSIVVVSPINVSEISSPLVISGRARGTWFFEGSFPVELLDSYRNIIAQGHVTAQGEWMTEDFVKFVGTLQFNNYIKGQKGILVLKKDNPSGLVENDDSVEVPIVFK